MGQELLMIATQKESFDKALASGQFKYHKQDSAFDSVGILV